MRARLLGWPGQVGIIFERKRFFERTLFEQKFSYIYTAYFSFKFLSKFGFFQKNAYSKEGFKKNLKEQNSKEKNEFRKNVIRSNDLVPIRLG